MKRYVGHEIAAPSRGRGLSLLSALTAFAAVLLLSAPVFANTDCSSVVRGKAGVTYRSPCRSSHMSSAPTIEIKKMVVPRLQLSPRGAGLMSAISLPTFRALVPNREDVPAPPAAKVAVGECEDAKAREAQPSRG